MNCSSRFASKQNGDWSWSLKIIQQIPRTFDKYILRIDSLFIYNSSIRLDSLNEKVTQDGRVLCSAICRSNIKSISKCKLYPRLLFNLELQIVNPRNDMQRKYKFKIRDCHARSLIHSYKCNYQNHQITAAYEKPGENLFNLPLADGKGGGASK